MIGISFNKKEFEYDAYTLVKAFYPKEDIEMYGTWEEEGPKDYEKLVSISYGDRVVIGVHTREHTLEDSAPYDEKEDRKKRKNTLKQILYKLLVQETGQTLPWGNLTGIRPVKIAMGLIEEGMTNAQAADFMRKTYFTSNEKTALAIAIANRERDILKDIDYKRGYSLYVGIPFCPSICLYCSFSSSPLEKWRDRVEDYLTALLKELDFISQAMKDRPLNTIYIGGGTPTTLEPDQLRRLLGYIQERFPVKDISEYTIEAGRPDSITREKLMAIREFPVTRISVNPQTMNQKTLDLIGRRHTVDMVKEKFYMARELGFDNINMDLIMGLPEETLEDVDRTLEEIRALSPDSLTVHSLAIKRAARLNMFKEEYSGLHIVNTPEMIERSAACARSMGMEPYYLYRQKNMAGNFENVGYARPGKACIYNILIMEEMQTIAACGAGTTTKVVFPKENRRERCENVKEVEQYIARIDEMMERKDRIGL